MMMNVVKRTATSAVLGGALLAGAGMGIASAQPSILPDGLVSVDVGNTKILDNVNSEVAATVAAAICGADTSEVRAMADQVDTAATDETVCDVPAGGVVIKQNVGVSAVPGQPNGVPAQANAYVPVQTAPAPTGPAPTEQGPAGTTPAPGEVVPGETADSTNG